MRYVACNYCQQDDTELVNQGPDLYLNHPGDFRLVRCRNCGLIYQNPQLTLDELLPHYPFEAYERYGTDAPEDGAPERGLVQRGLVRRCERIMDYRERPGAILDVGCATGDFLGAMRQRGWEVSGVELNPEAAHFARTHRRLDVYTGTLEEAEFEANCFDVVTMWDVFEHVVDPRMTLREVGRILRPGGLLGLSLPNPVGLEARLFGDAWAGWDRPRHLHLFTPTVIRRYLHEAGFRHVRIESLGGRLKVTLLSVGYLCHARGIPRERWEPWLERLYNWPLRLLTWPLYRIAELLNQTTTMTVFARLQDARQADTSRSDERT